MPPIPPNPVRQALAAKYVRAKVNPEHQREISNTIDKIVANKGRYDEVSRRLPTIPWWAVAVIHSMECDLNFHQHLHNGDPLTARTRNDPAGLPRTGSPTFEWEYSAVDALKHDELDKHTDWSVGATLDIFERYNGVGCRALGVPSPYLWSYTDQYVSGKFVADHKYDPHAVSKQSGVVPLLKELERRSLVKF